MTDSEQGQRLNFLRRLSGMTLGEISAAAGISLTYLSELERGNRRGSPETVARLNAVLVAAGTREMARMKRLEATPA